MGRDKASKLPRQMGQRLVVEEVSSAFVCVCVCVLFSFVYWGGRGGVGYEEV